MTEVISNKEMDMIGEYIKRNNIKTAEEFKACVDRDIAAKKLD